MINLQFNSLCPLCNKPIALNSIDKHHECWTCKAFLYYSTIDNKLTSITFDANIQLTPLLFNSYSIDFIQNTLTIKFYQKFKIQNLITIPLPDFSSLQDLIQISNTLILFN